MLRHMEEGRFEEAFRELKRLSVDPSPGGVVPPPHALWRLGRLLAEKRQLRRARLPLQLFLDLYENHMDRPKVMLDLARVLAELGQTRKAVALKQAAEGR